MNLVDGNFWGNILQDVVANLIWCFLTAGVTSAYVFRKDRSKFSGRWKGEISWKSDWAKEMLIGSVSSDPNSEGEIALSYGSGTRQNQYWGLSFWQLRDGTKSLSELCVELRGVELKHSWSKRFPFVTSSIFRAKLSSKIRREYDGFNYVAEFASYEIYFFNTTEDLLKGIVYAKSQRNNQRREVGLFSAERLT